MNKVGVTDLLGQAAVCDKEQFKTLYQRFHVGIRKMF